MKLIAICMAVSAVLVLAASPVFAVDPPPNEGIGVLCMYTDFDDVDGCQDGEVFYPEYSMFTPMDLYTVLYYPQGSGQALVAAAYSVYFRQGEHAVEFGSDFGYLVDEFVPAYDGEVDVWYGGDDVSMYCIPAHPHDGVAVVIRHSQLFLIDLPLPGASIEVYFGPEGPWEEYPVYVDDGDWDIVRDAVPNSADHAVDNPVFVLHGDVVAMESRSLSDIKQLFR